MLSDQQALLMWEVCDFKDIEGTSNLQTPAMDKELPIGHFLTPWEKFTFFIFKI